MPTVSALWGPRRENREFKATLGHTGPAVKLEGGLREVAETPSVQFPRDGDTRASRTHPHVASPLPLGCVSLSWEVGKTTSDGKVRDGVVMQSHGLHSVQLPLSVRTCPL